MGRTRLRACRQRVTGGEEGMVEPGKERGYIKEKLTYRMSIKRL